MHGGVLDPAGSRCGPLIHENSLGSGRIPGRVGDICQRLKARGSRGRPRVVIPRAIDHGFFLVETVRWQRHRGLIEQQALLEMRRDQIRAGSVAGCRRQVITPAGIPIVDLGLNLADRIGKNTGRRPGRNRRHEFPRGVRKHGAGHCAGDERANAALVIVDEGAEIGKADAVGGRLAIDRQIDNSGFGDGLLFGALRGPCRSDSVIKLIGVSVGRRPRRVANRRLYFVGTPGPTSVTLLLVILNDSCHELLALPAFRLVQLP